MSKGKNENSKEFVGICITPVDRRSFYVDLACPKLRPIRLQLDYFLLFEMWIIVTLDLWSLSCLDVIEFVRKQKNICFGKVCNLYSIYKL